MCMADLSFSRHSSHVRSSVSPSLKTSSFRWPCPVNSPTTHLLEYNALYSAGCQPMYRRNMSLPSSGLKNKPSKKPAWKQVTSRTLFAFTLVFWLAYSSTLKMKASCSSETSVDVQRNTRRYIPVDRTLHNHRCENLISCMYVYTLWVLIWTQSFEGLIEHHVIYAYGGMEEWLQEFLISTDEVNAHLSPSTALL
jgi:hypothetical protein